MEPEPPKKLVIDYESPLPARPSSFLELPPMGVLATEVLVTTQLVLIVLGDTVEYQSVQYQAIYVIIWLPVFLCASLRQWRVVKGILKPDFIERIWWKIVWALLVVMLVFSIRHDRCPHASYWVAGPFSWTFGKACGNPRHFRSILSFL